MAKSERLREIFAFLVVGGLSAGIDGLVFLILIAFGVHPVLSSVLGFLTSFMFNFVANQRVVFRAKRNRWQLVRYVTLVAFNLGLSAGIVAAGLAIGLEPVVAKGISLVLIATFNYVMLRRWVFRATPESPPGSAEDGSAPASGEG